MNTYVKQKNPVGGKNVTQTSKAFFNPYNCLQLKEKIASQYKKIVD